MNIYLAGIPGGGWVKRERDVLDRYSKRLWSYHWLIATEGKEMERIYLAGTTILPERERRVLELKQDRLVSFHFIQPGRIDCRVWKETIEGEIMNNLIKLFLDSGAYSAYSQGITIDIQEYIQFIKKYEDKLEVYANLDVIGDAAATFKNQVTMERAGLKPLPCFHYGDDFSWLKKYLSRGHEYMALGGMVPISNADLLPWLDELWSNHLTDAEGLPIIKIHGFGMTSFQLMLRYPWFSVDSTSWIITGRNGSVYVPAYRDGKYVYSEAPYKVNVSNRSPDAGIEPDHIESMPKHVRKVCEQYIIGKGYCLGKSEFVMVASSHELTANERWTEKKAIREKKGQTLIERILERGLSNDYRKRDEMNIIYFADLEASMQPYPWAFKLKKKHRGLGVGL